MKTLKKIKLNGLNDAELRDREMDALNGGDRTCGCGCRAVLLLPVFEQLFVGFPHAYLYG